MADNKSKQDGRVDSKIDANDASEVAYTTEQFGVSATKIKEAIKTRGNSRAAVKSIWRASKIETFLRRDFFIDNFVER